MKRVILLMLFFYFTASFSKEAITEKNIFLKHLYHNHEIHFYNVTVFQGIKDYSALNNISYLFVDYFFTPDDKVFVNIAYAFNEGLDPYLAKKGYTLQTYSGDIKASVENINGTNRDYLLELWYAKNFENLEIAAGLVDISGFTDNTEYSQSGQEQFMSSMFVNSPIAYEPSYNPGVLIRYKLNNEYKIKFGFSTFKPENGYYSIFELDYGKNSLNIKPYFYKSINSDFDLTGSGIAWDYTAGKNGLWGRIGKNFNGNLYHFSIGYVRKGFLTKRSLLGLAYGFVEGDISQHVIESYYRKKIVKHFWITADLQYIKEERKDLVYGLRTELSF